MLEPTDVLALDTVAAARTELPAGLPVVVGGGDGPLANLGVGAVVPGTAAVSLGTSAALRVATVTPAVDVGGRTFCYLLADDTWVIGGAVSNGGVVAQWASELLGADLAELLSEAIAVAPGAAGLLALPALLSERWRARHPGLQLGRHPRGGGGAAAARRTGGNCVAPRDGHSGASDVTVGDVALARRGGAGTTRRSGVLVRREGLGARGVRRPGGLPILAGGIGLIGDLDGVLPTVVFTVAVVSGLTTLVLLYAWRAR